jgi:hypothetical protein
MSNFPLMLSLPGLIADPTKGTDLNGFAIGDIDIADRGRKGGGVSRSPIRYTTAGTAPDRIFKLELANAGFLDELAIYNTMDDSINLQIWIYETSNIVEYHFGSSRISNPNDYFHLLGSGPVMGYLKHVDYDMFSGGNVYYLKDSSSVIKVDTFALPPSAFPPYALSAWPADGTVFRFTPSICLAPDMPVFTVGAPNGNTVRFAFAGNPTGIDSVVWNFGDGTTLTVATGVSVPVTHTFPGPGKYPVSMTAYNACGGTTSNIKQASLAVGNIAALGNVHIYPNPATSQLTIEGMEGGTATIMSLVGQAVMRTKLTTNKTQLAISTLPAGSYTILLTTPQGKTGAMQFIKH